MKKKTKKQKTNKIKKLAKYYVMEPPILLICSEKQEDKIERKTKEERGVPFLLQTIQRRGERSTYKGQAHDRIRHRMDTEQESVKKRKHTHTHTHIREGESEGRR